MYTYAILYILLCPGVLLVSAENNASLNSNIANTNSNGLQIVEVKPTETPKISTVKPTIAPKIKKLPSSAIVSNLPPTRADKDLNKADAKSQSADIKKTNDNISESHSADLKSNNDKPMQVSGFVTENGSVFEITDLNGIGKIEGRQTSNEDEKESNVNVCNYGSIVVYSDVPCDEVTDVKVGDVDKTSTDTDSTPAELVSNSQSQQEQQQQQQNLVADTSPVHDANDLEHLDDLEIAEKLDQLQKEKRRRLNRNRRRKINRNRRRQLQNRRRYNNNRQRYGNNNNNINRIQRRGYSQQPHPYRRRQQQQRRQQQYRHRNRYQQNQKRRRQ